MYASERQLQTHHIASYRRMSRTFVIRNRSRLRGIFVMMLKNVHNVIELEIASPAAAGSQ